MNARRCSRVGQSLEQLQGDSLFSVLDASNADAGGLLPLMPRLLLEPKASGFMEGAGLRLLKWA